MTRFFHTVSRHLAEPDFAAGACIVSLVTVIAITLLKFWR